MKKILSIFIILLFLNSGIYAAGSKTGIKEEKNMTAVINAVEYGFYNDGKTFNDKIMAKYIESDCSTPIYFPGGCYLFEEGFNFPRLFFVELAPNAEFKLDSKEIREYFITMGRGRSEGGYAFNAYFKGGYINANNKANNGIGVNLTRHVVFEDFYVKNVLEKGIVTMTEARANGQSFFRNILVENDYGRPGTIGIYDNANDTHFDQIEVVNFETAYDTACGRFNCCAAWIRDNSIVENSTFAVIRGHAVTFVSPAVDTYRYGFKLAYGNAYNGALISDMLWITNGNVYNSDLRAKYPRIIFNSPTDNGGFKVCGLDLPCEDNLDFSNIPLNKSLFINVTVIGTGNPDEMIKYYRNDNETVTGKITKSTNFDTLKAGSYECCLTTGYGGKGYPKLSESGVLEVSAVGDIIIQKFMGEKTFAYRLNTGSGFGSWIINK